mmetsp:Transcript_20589/g.19928  ORF Transcript_20589/g.19928 Transcript_20589/m.19928 type:complete len:338 (-) Transcript_20589:203-1216(-)
MEQPVGRRRSGFQLPLNILQVGTWTLFPIFIIHYFAFLYPLLWNFISVKVIVTLVFLVSTLLALYFGYMVCSIDPADDHLLVESVQSTEENPVYCYLCEMTVDCSSKHCRFCDKCVVGFDHHCKWLNTCVGSKNYRYFLSAIGAITVKTSLLLLLSIAFLIEAYAYPERFQSRLTEVNFEYTNLPAGTEALYLPLDGVRGILIASCIFYLPLVLLVYQLVGFHSMLVFKGITTYDFIVAEQKRQRDRASSVGRSAEIRASRTGQQIHYNENENSVHEDVNDDQGGNDIELNNDTHDKGSEGYIYNRSLDKRYNYLNENIIIIVIIIIIIIITIIIIT